MSKNLGQELNRIMASTIVDWPDVVAMLQRIIKCLAKYNSTDHIEREIYLRLFKKCHLFMNPKLPAGVHAKVMELYKLIWCNLDESEKQTYMQYLVLSLQSFGLISMKMKATMIEVFELFVLSPLGSCGMPIIASILPGIEEEQSETYLPCIDLLGKICKNVNESHFYTTIWHIIINYPECRIPGLMYLIKTLPTKIDIEDIVFLFSGDQHIVVSAFEACFNDPDPSGLVHRNALDVLLYFSMDHPVFESLYLKRLIHAALLACLKRDMSLNKRLFQWICPSELYFKNISSILFKVLREKILNDPYNSFKILISLMDKPLAMNLICDLIPFIIAYLSSHSFISSAQSFLESIPKQTIWTIYRDFLYLEELPNKIPHKNNPQIIFKMFFEKYTFQENSDRNYYLPLTLANILINLPQYMVDTWIYLFQFAKFDTAFVENFELKLSSFENPETPIQKQTIYHVIIKTVQRLQTCKSYSSLKPIAMVFLHLSSIKFFTEPLGILEEDFQIEKDLSDFDQAEFCAFMIAYRYFQDFKIKNLKICMQRIQYLWLYFEKYRSPQSMKYLVLIDVNVKLLDTFLSEQILQRRSNSSRFLHRLRLLLSNCSHEFFVPRTLFSLIVLHRKGELPTLLFLEVVQFLQENCKLHQSSIIYHFSSMCNNKESELFFPYTKKFGNHTITYFKPMKLINYHQLLFVYEVLLHFFGTITDHLHDLIFQDQRDILLMGETIRLMAKRLMIIPEEKHVGPFLQMEEMCIKLMSVLVEKFINFHIDELRPLLNWLYEFSFDKFHLIGLSMQTSNAMIFFTFLEKVEKLYMRVSTITKSTLTRQEKMFTIFNVIHHLALNSEMHKITQSDFFSLLKYLKYLNNSIYDIYPYFCYYLKHGLHLLLQNQKVDEQSFVATQIIELLSTITYEAFIGLIDEQPEIEMSSIDFSLGESQMITISPLFINLKSKSVLNNVQHLADLMILLIEISTKSDLKIGQLVDECLVKLFSSPNRYIVDAVAILFEFYDYESQKLIQNLFDHFDSSINLKICMKLCNLIVTGLNSSRFTNTQFYILLLTHIVNNSKMEDINNSLIPLVSPIIKLDLFKLELKTKVFLIEMIDRIIVQTMASNSLFNDKIQIFKCVTGALGQDLGMFIAKQSPVTTYDCNILFTTDDSLIFVAYILKKLPQILENFRIFVRELDLFLPTFMVLEQNLNALLKKSFMFDNVIEFYSLLSEDIKSIKEYKKSMSDVLQDAYLFDKINVQNYDAMSRIANFYARDVDFTILMDLQNTNSIFASKKQELLAISMQIKKANLFLFLLDRGKCELILRTFEEKFLKYINDYYVDLNSDVFLLIFLLLSKISNTISFTMWQTILYEIYEFLYANKENFEKTLKLIELCDVFNFREYECFKHLLFPRSGNDVEDEYHKSVLLEILDKLNESDYEQVQNEESEILDDDILDSEIEAKDLILIGKTNNDNKKLKQAILRIVAPTRYNIRLEDLEDSFQKEVLTSK
eukprot:NODE_246_length_11841_cov_1.234032.p1 type:complete len:1492 gc:universal NODE_246_length_11841_cov_1.234032:4398-8873(+)